jgi:hypothetical protein
MNSESTAPMPEPELRRNMALLGAPPVLSTENAKDFEETFLEIAKCFKVQDLLMVDLAWQYSVNSLFIRRNMRHSTIGVERWSRRNREIEEMKAQYNKALYEKKLQNIAEKISRTPEDVAEMAALEEKIAQSVSEIDGILAHKATEIDHNRALQVNVEFQQNLDQLINSATRRRNEAFYLLERYSTGLGRAVEEAVGKIVDAEFKEIESETEIPTESKIEYRSAITAAPSISPGDDETPDDVKPPDRSESAQ